jgi:hypothetical protein
MKLTSLFKRLDQRGAGHLLLPLVVVAALAIGGTYMLVASHANPASNLAAIKTKNTPAKSKLTGWLVVYNSDGVSEYKKAKISSSGTQSPKGSFSCNGINRTISFGSTGNKLLTCKGTNNTAKYNVAYSTANGGFNSSFAVDVDPGFCTLVYPNPAMTAKVRPNSKNVCPQAPATIVKKDVSVRLLLNTPKAGAKSVSGFAEVSPGGAPVNKKWCSGSVQLTFIDSSGANAGGNYSFPIKYVAGSAAKGSHNGISYCVAKFGSAGRGKLKAGQSYTVYAHFSGGAYFNPADGSSSITMPAAKAHTVKSTTTQVTSGGVSAP